MPLSLSPFSPIGPAVSSLDADRDCPAVRRAFRLRRPGDFLHAALHPPAIAPVQSDHLGGAIGRCLLSSLARIAVQAALYSIREVATACRPDALSGYLNGTPIVLPGPRAVTTVFSVSRQNLLHPNNSAAVLTFKHCGVRECAKFSKAGVPW